jgi:hypothetical protein
MIKKFESFSDDFKEELKEYLSDVSDLYDVELIIWTKEEYLESDEVKDGYIDGNQSRFADQSNYIVKFNMQSYPMVKKEFSIANINKPTEYSLDGTIKASKHNYDLLNSIKMGLDRLRCEYYFYIKNINDCYLFISRE